MGHGQAEDPQTPYSGALELQDIYASIGVYSELKTLVMRMAAQPVMARGKAWLMARPLRDVL